MLQPVQGVGECPELPVDVTHALHDLNLGVQQLDGLCVGVVASSEGTLVRGGELAETRLCNQVFCLAFAQSCTTITGKTYI